MSERERESDKEMELGDPIVFIAQQLYEQLLADLVTIVLLYYGEWTDPTGYTFVGSRILSSGPCKD